MSATSATAQLFTTYTVGLTLLTLFVNLPAEFVDYIRALVLIVAAAVIYTYARYGIDSVRRLYTQHLPNITVPPDYVLIGIDFILHLGPVLLLGLPRSIKSLAAGYLTFILWYILVRHKIHELYIDFIPLCEYDLLVTVIIPIILAIVACVLKN